VVLPFSFTASDKSIEPQRTQRRALTNKRKQRMETPFSAFPVFSVVKLLLLLPNAKDGLAAT